MTDKKILTAIIKRLDRVIALLDNCYDTGDMSESTRGRLVEMLHTSISEIYSIGKQSEQEDIETNLPITQTIETPKTFISELAIDEKQEEEKENITTNNEVVTPEVTQVVEEVIAEQIPETLLETVVPEVSEKVEEKRNRIDDILIELESPTSLDYFAFEVKPTVEETVTVSEPVAIETIEQEPLVETIVAQEPEPVVINRDKIEDEERIANEKAQLADLRNQLESERKRLEEELQSWQKERLKREEEMKAAEKLLTALEAETQKRKAFENNIIHEAIITPQTITPEVVVNPTHVISQVEPQKVTTTNGVTTLADKLSEKRQFLSDTFNTEDLQLQGVTPIADLTRAIGINDKFQFIKELFGGDSDRYTDAIRTLNNLNNIQEAFNYIETHFNWDKNNDAVKRVILLIRRRYM